MVMNYENRKKILISPWDFCLYSIDKNTFLLEVVFIEGNYKVEISRYYLFHNDETTNIITSSMELLDDMKTLSIKIRGDKDSYSIHEIDKSEFNKLS